jgi:hypothetical protein
MTRQLTEHERAALACVREVLSQAREEGYIIPGHFEARKKDLKGKEIDGILVLPGLVLLLELKSRKTERIDLWGLEEPMRVWRDGTPADEPNPLTGLWYVSQAVRGRLKRTGLEAAVYPVLIADAYGRPFKLRVGRSGRPWGVVSGVAACKPKDIALLLEEIRQSLSLSSPYPLDSEGREELKRLADAVRGSVRPRVSRQRKRVGEFVLFDPPLFQEPEFSLYRGKEMDTNQPVWVKEYHRDLLATGERGDVEQTLVLRDAVALVSLGDHPNLVRYKTKVDRGEYIYVILKRESGWFLYERIERGNLTLAEKLRILLDLLAGLAHIHSHKEGERTALYRDLRPESVFVIKEARAQLFNFDCTRLPARSTAFEQAKGRAQRWRAYASFELLNAELPEQVGTPTDVYSWGVLAYELLTGQLPYADEHKAAQGQFTPVAEFRLPVLRPLQALIEQALSPVPEERPLLTQLQSAVQEAIDALG